MKSEKSVLRRLTVVVAVGAVCTLVGCVAMPGHLAGEPDLTVPDDFSTIGEAVAAADAGDTIMVRVGSYRENVVIGKPLTLVGENPETTAIVGLGTGDVVRIEADNVTVHGFTIRGSGREHRGPFEGGDAGIKLVGVKNCRISVNTLEGNSLGIMLGWASENVLEENTCRGSVHEGIYLRESNGNTIRNNTSDANGGHGGIYLNPACSENAVEYNICRQNPDHGIKIQNNSNHNILRGNTCLSNGNGIFLQNVFANEVVGNTCQSSNQAGIFLRSSEDNAIVDNRCEENGEAGIQLDFLNFHNRIEGNACTANTRSGIFLRLASSGNILERNDVSANGESGLDIEYSEYNEARLNRISDNGWYGVRVMHIDPASVEQWKGFLEQNSEIATERIDRGMSVETEDSGGHVFTWNNIENNERGCEFAAPGIVDAAENWWGDASGPYHQTENPDGAGEQIYGESVVVVKPWLESPKELGF